MSEAKVTLNKAHGLKSLNLNCARSTIMIMSWPHNLPFLICEAPSTPYKYMAFDQVFLEYTKSFLVVIQGIGLTCTLLCFCIL
jgi:hypothetical protein